MHSLSSYVDSLCLVFTLLIVARAVLSWIPTAPRARPVRASVAFLHSATEWFIAPFRRVVPRVGMLDLSPLVALLVLGFMRGILVGLLSGA